MDSIALRKEIYDEIINQSQEFKSKTELQQLSEVFYPQSKKIAEIDAVFKEPSHIETFTDQNKLEFGSHDETNNTECSTEYLCNGHSLNDFTRNLNDTICTLQNIVDDSDTNASNCLLSSSASLEKSLPVCDVTSNPGAVDCSNPSRTSQKDVFKKMSKRGRKKASANKAFKRPHADETIKLIAAAKELGNLDAKALLRFKLLGNQQSASKNSRMHAVMCLIFNFAIQSAYLGLQEGVAKFFFATSAHTKGVKLCFQYFPYTEKFFFCQKGTMAQNGPPIYATVYNHS